MIFNNIYQEVKAVGEQTQSQVLGEQLIGLSPTVCRRIIRWWEAELKDPVVLEEDAERYRDCPLGLKGLLKLLEKQTGIESPCERSFSETKNGKSGSFDAFLREEVVKFLFECEMFLDVIEGEIGAV